MRLTGGAGVRACELDGVLPGPVAIRRLKSSTVHSYPEYYS